MTKFVTMIIISFKEIIEINTVLSKCVNTGLSVRGLLSLIDIKEEVSKHFSKYKEAISAIIKEFNIPVGDEGLIVDGHNKQEINSKINTLLTSNVELLNHNSLSIEDFVKICSNLSLNQIEILNKYIRSK